MTLIPSIVLHHDSTILPDENQEEEDLVEVVVSMAVVEEEEDEGLPWGEEEVQDVDLKAEDALDPKVEEVVGDVEDPKDEEDADNRMDVQVSFRYCL